MCVVVLTQVHLLKLSFLLKEFITIRVCGQLRGFQFGSPDGFRNGNKKIDSCYVDDISITYGSNPRKHIWTFVNALTCDNVPYLNNCCPCNSDNTAAS